MLLMYVCVCVNLDHQLTNIYAVTVIIPITLINLFCSLAFAGNAVSFIKINYCAYTVIVLI